jgi:hypothetical protein
MAKKKPDIMEDKGEVTALALPEVDVKTPEKDYVPDGFDSVEEYLNDVRETYTLDIEADDDNRTAALEDKKFVAGEQWDSQVLQARAGLPCLTINTIPQFIAQLVGDWRTNKTAVKVLPAETGDKAIADVRSDLIRSIETKSRADRAYNLAFESMTQCGDGDLRVAVQYCGDDVFDQEIVILPVEDCLSVVWDRLSMDPTGRDATHCFVDDVLPTKEFEARWPNDKPSTLSDRERKPLEANGWLDSKTVKVTEHWRMIERKKLLVMFEDGTMYPFEEDQDPDKLDTYIQKHGKPTKSRIAPCLYAQMHLVTGYAILAGPYEWKLERLPIIRMSGRTVSVGDRRVRYGLVRFMKDAARLRNFWRSVAAEQLGYAPKAQWIANESAVEGRENEIRKAHLTRDPLLIINDDAIIDQNIKRLDPPPIQMALLNEAQVNTQDMKDVTGIHDASLGIKSNETSGKAIMARQREGDIGSLTFYDNGNASILEVGDVINQLIPQIYDGTRIIRIIGEDEATKLVKINDPNDPASPDLSVGRYDVAVSTGASYTTRRVEAAEAMMEAIQVYPQLMQIAGDLIVKAQDWPGAEELSDRLVKTIPPQFLSDKEKQEMGNQPDVQALMQQQAQAGEQLQAAMQELQKLQQENQSLKLKHDVEAKKLEIEEYKAETDRLTAYAQVLKSGDEMEIKRLESNARQQLEAEESENEHNVAVAGLMQKHAIANQDRQYQAQQADADRAAQPGPSGEEA